MQLTLVQRLQRMLKKYTIYKSDKTKADIVIDVTDNENQNVITFVYSKKDYKVTFNTDGNGTITGKQKIMLSITKKYQKFLKIIQM